MVKWRIVYTWQAQKDAKKIVAPLKGRPVFLTFDLDGFDSSLMQATGTGGCWVRSNPIRDMQRDDEGAGPFKALSRKAEA